MGGLVGRLMSRLVCGFVCGFVGRICTGKHLAGRVEGRMCLCGEDGRLAIILHRKHVLHRGHGSGRDAGSWGECVIRWGGEGRWFVRGLLGWSGGFMGRFKGRILGGRSAGVGYVIGGEASRFELGRERSGLPNFECGLGGCWDGSRLSARFVSGLECRISGGFQGRLSGCG